MLHNDPPGFFNDPDLIAFLNGERAGIPAHVIDQPSQQQPGRSTGVDLNEIRTRIQQLHRSNMKVIS